ncbi:MAG: AMP-binding protein [Oligoflexia bacterium]|nr:AMP-binding protein [Oligoflexia bacterium]
MQIIDNQYNIGHICSNLQVMKGNGGQLALRYLGQDLNSAEDYTFGQLEVESNRAANLILHLGLQPGEVVLILLPKIPDLFFSFLGILKNKCIAGILFSSLGEDSIYDRIIDSNAKCIITKKSLLKKVIARSPKIMILLVDAEVNEENLGKNIFSYKKIISQMSTEFNVPLTTAETPSVLHYTSGSTGKPKGVLHKHGSVVLQSDTMKNILFANYGDRYWCTADQGWITGVSYGIIAPWSCGITQVHYAGAYNAESWLKILEKEKINIWYTAPTALRMMMQEEDSLIKSFDLSALKHILSVGEPLNPEVIHWSRKVLNKEIYDTWFQTETGSIMIANRPGKKIKPGSMGLASNEMITPEIISEDGRILEVKTEGFLCLKAPFPSMFLAYINHQELYENKFKNGYYYSGDLAYKDEDGYFWFLGRCDDIINTAGHLVSPFEVESALLEMDCVSESAVIGAPDDLLFEKVVAFISLKPGYLPSKKLELSIRIHVSNRVSSTATPQTVIFSQKIPKNNSGKIMRRILKNQYMNKEIGDISTLQ